MSDEDVIRGWRTGRTVEGLTKSYMEVENKKRKRTGDKKITKIEALTHVESIIFKFQTNLMRGAEDGDNDRGTIKTDA